MIRITELDSSSKQRLELQTDDGSIAVINLEFRQNQNKWYISISHPNLSINNLGLSASPNILRSYRNIINFGISVSSNDGLDPYFIQDFSSDRIRMYLLDQSDVNLVEREFYD